MEMEMLHRLTRVGSRICHQAEPALGAREALGELFREGDDFPEQELVSGPKIRKPADMFLGDKEQMEGRLRLNVLERHNFIILVDDGARYFFICNLTKYALAHGNLLLTTDVQAPSTKSRINFKFQ
jgi:hypothetical protein